MKNSVIKIALGAPKIRVADVEGNLKECLRLAREAYDKGAKLLVLPELCLTGSTAGDLFFQSALIDAAEDALGEFIRRTEKLDMISFIGLPIMRGDRLYNAVAAVCRGELIGISTAAAGTRHFSAADDMVAVVDGTEVPMHDSILYMSDDGALRIYVEIGDDFKDIIPGSAYAALSGANIILNPTAMTEYLGLADKRRASVAAMSERLSCAYVQAGAGEGESGTDGIFAAPRIVASLGEIILDAELFGEGIVTAEIDLEAISSDRRRRDEFKDSPAKSLQTVEFEIKDLTHEIEEAPERLPFVPKDEAKRAEACELALKIQSRALAGRIERAYAKCCVLGVSGGLDSTLALLAAAGAMDTLGRDRKSIIAITMPCFGTTERTKSNALSLAEELGCTVRTIDIKDAVTLHFKDIEHKDGDYGVVYENAQARERTQILMDIANAEGGFVVGTGDLSELALGFATYNGDHMSMYGVNASVPKTLMRAIIRQAAKRAELEGKPTLARVLIDVVETPVSPELLPTEAGECVQHTEAIVGPYELHDFFLYYAVGYGYPRERILRLATLAFLGEYGEDEIEGYLDVFYRRFFSQQFKRSCLPDGPRVTKISLSPRGSFVMPSDSVASLFRK